MAAILIYLLSLIIVVVTAWFIHYHRYNKYLKNVKGPRPLPVLGNSHEFGSAAKTLSNFRRYQKNYGGILKIWLGFAPPMILTTDYEFLELLLGSAKNLDKSDDYRFLLPWLGTGLLTSKGSKWRKHRKIITPAFHFQILEKFVEVFDSYTNILIEKLAEEVGKDSTNIYPYITHCSLDIICATAMGIKLNAQENAESEYISSVKEMCRIVVDRATSAFKMNKILYYLSKDYWKERRALKILHNYTYSVIQSRTKELENEEDSDSFVDDVGIKKKKAFIDLLLQYRKDGQTLTDEDIREEVDTFMFAGHDTTASSMSSILYCLATNPEVQEKVVEELQSIFAGDNKRPATHRDLQEMKYLDAVIKETLRLYPSAPFFGRHLNEDIKYGDIVIPKNVTLEVFVYGLHRRADIYPDPERFDPERFTLENQTKRPPYAYIPFSAGPRNCIGQKFAVLEMKAVTSKLLRNYELHPTVPLHKLELVAETILKSSNGVCIRLKKREF